MKRFLVRHLGNMGDMVFFIPPVLETLKAKYPDSHITFVTAWGFKVGKKGKWGERNQSGFSLHLMLTNPHIDQLIHWHDTKMSLEGLICREDGQSIPTWSRSYYEEQKASGNYDGVFELDFGIGHEENPMERMYEAIGLPEEAYSNYKLYFTDSDKAAAQQAISDFPRPRIVLLEGIEGATTRGWDPAKVRTLEHMIEEVYGTPPIWFGGKHTRYIAGQPLTLRQNIATLLFCDVAIGVLSGPLHFAAAAGLPTITLYGDHPLHRTAPAFFLNRYISAEKKLHRTILGPTNPNEIRLLKGGTTAVNLTPAEFDSQGYADWHNPGRQSTKSCVSVITPEEVMAVLESSL